MSFQGIAPVLFESVSSVTATNSVELGTRATVAGSDYLYVYNAGATSLAQGAPACLLSFSSGYSVTASNAASQAGFFVGHVQHAAIPAASYGWVMTKGYANIVPDASAVSMATGALLALGVDGGYVAAAATLSTALPIGFTLSGVVTAYTTTNRAWIKSPFYA